MEGFGDWEMGDTFGETGDGAKNSFRGEGGGEKRRETTYAGGSLLSRRSTNSGGSSKSLYPVVDGLWKRGTPAFGWVDMLWIIITYVSLMSGCF